MAAGRLGANSAAAQRFNASGEATEQEKLPERYISTPAATSPISGHMNIPTDFRSLYPSGHDAVVRRWPRMVGMRYLYAHGMRRMPIHPLGADGRPIPWDSNFQPYNHGPIYDAGFNDALYQAGYPGFNLGLSFKVPTVNRNPQTTPQVQSNKSVARNVSQTLSKLRRPSGRARRT